MLAAQPLKVPVMLVAQPVGPGRYLRRDRGLQGHQAEGHGERQGIPGIGPWHHGQEIGDGSSLGALKFHSDTALYFRQNILRPFLDHYLKDDAPASGVPPVTAYETGTNTWLRLPSWPAGCAERLHDEANAVLS